MALPVAQLGYMANLGSPGRGPTTVIDDPWQQLAVQALGAAITKGIGNSFEKDYTTQAQNEGLAVDPTAKAAAWYKKPFTGATTDESQLQNLRGERAQTARQTAAEAAATSRQQEMLNATREEGKATRAHQIDVRRLDQMFQGGENAADRANRTDLQNAELLFRGLEGSASRTNAVDINNADNAAAMERLNAQIKAEEASLGRKLTSEEQQMVVKSFIDTAGKMTLGAPAETARTQLLNPGAPPVDSGAAIDALALKLKSMGYQITPIQR